ncbi:bifunctional 23S rRNA (guanine(2069)-N(7))-methyltransferase RlmK/23S rRNA (guanine(2445)-N(2))-methyltransferase RlmL [Marinobacter caseinilyticus]|uniref:bifunctional 23S rRNA (guanine(2069)-N(7))-methyltransferase RlmK/23S rRNA (guanine(2445)-N(2))-methyltransferase RlmL n=1 Tax=Marinobacter caseinilyticus TaxID=2692195 RepID=UPI001F44B2C9|nr:bifunctional 23S rRNA (guanine(2069)-N(7))-methyltransferase RlmK/23S rRNA (guanine(2445)-N(2))-methyltransferase RlmL [Marinobacter caseinilyticus]
MLMFFVTCPKGLEYLLADELQSFGFEPVRNAPAGVWVQGTLEAGYRACLWSRLANRVILHLAEVSAISGDELYEGVRAIAWENHLPVDGRFKVAFVGQNDAIRNTQYGAQRVKDGVVDNLRTDSGERPSIDTVAPDLIVSARLHRGLLQVGIDLSGESLHKRGYRTEKGVAPLKENLAAALLLRSGWPELSAAGGGFVDPMCGSGTLAIEAALMAMDHAPGLLRAQFGFTHWLGHQAELWDRLVGEAKARAEQGRSVNTQPMVGFDQDAAVVATGLRNVERAGLKGVVRLECRALGAFARDAQWPDTGLVLTNPPYGERLSERNALSGLYQSLGEAVKQALPGWRLGVFTGAPEVGHAIGLRSYKQYKLFNGKLPAQLLLFEISKDNETIARERTATGELFPKISHPERAEMLRNRLRKNRKAMGQWVRKQGIECYRLYDADMPEFALAIDVYGERLHVQEYAPPKSVDARLARERLAEALAVIPDALEIDPSLMVCKQRQRQTGINQYEKQAATSEFFTVHEHGCALKVNLKDYLDTGLFLDHRPVRHWIQQHADGKRFLNLFCYTGAATVHAAVGGAVSSLSLDMSNTYVNWARDNLELNRVPASQHVVKKADCLDWLAAKPNAGDLYDLIFMDPPTFSNSAKMDGVLDIQRDHALLISQAMARLAPDGLLIFSNNFRRFKLANSVEAQYRVDEVSKDTIDKDFLRNARIHRCWHIRHGR